MHDPFQTHPATGQYYGTPGLTNPFYAQQITPLNPLALLNPLAATAGISPIGGMGQAMSQPYNAGTQGGINPQQLQLASILAAQQIAALQGLQQNPLFAAGLFNSPWNPMLAAAGFGAHPGLQGISPFGQTGGQLAPQSWVNQGGLICPISAETRHSSGACWISAAPRRDCWKSQTLRRSSTARS
jgi:hypothetical protein